MPLKKRTIRYKKKFCTFQLANGWHREEFLASEILAIKKTQHRENKEKLQQNGVHTQWQWNCVKITHLKIKWTSWSFWDTELKQIDLIKKDHT